MMTIEDARTKIAALPTFSRSVYYALNSALYAEPGFSDVEASDLAEEIGVTAEAIGGALKKLSEVGLAHSVPSDVNGQDYNFLYTAAHDDHGDNPGWQQLFVI